VAIILNEISVAAQPVETGVMRQRLLTDERVKGTSLLFDRITLAAGATLKIELSPKSMAWFQMLEGKATFHSLYSDWLTDVHSMLLPPRISATLWSEHGASVVYAEIPDAGRLDPGFTLDAPLLMAVDWTREEVFASEHDGRKRVPLVNSKMSDTAAMKIEMVVYPAGCASPKYHHEGASTLMYLLSGRGIAWADEQRYPARAGDLLYFPDREPHYLKADDAGEMRFLEIYVPGAFKTVWAEPSKMSAWKSTDRDIHGRETLQDQRLRRSFRFTNAFVI
jgi:quercetin dioxygenase-like cupin family protein